MDLHPYLSICSGSGYLDVGVERGSGGSAFPICYVEREATSAAVLAHGFKTGTLVEAPIWSDLRTFDFRAWRGKVEGIIGGYPCPPFSSGGARLGEADPRHLWPVIKSGIEAVRPVWCFFENVANHLFIGFDEVARSLQNMGFEVAATLITAEEVGASHRRERLFILAYTDDARSQRRIFQRSACSEERKNTGRSIAGSSDPVANASGERAAQNVHEQSIHADQGFRKIPTYAPGPSDESWNSYPIGLQPAIDKSEFHRMADGLGNWLDLSANDRIRIIGNGVVPDAAALAWRELWREIG